MGPAAGFDLAQKITQMTPAQSDADHIPLLVASIPTIPDRTEALTYEGPDFVPAIVQVGQQLIKAGATHLVMACNTAHAKHDRIQSQLSVPLFNLPDIIMQQVANLGIKKVVLFASDGTLISGVYNKAAANNQIELIYPTSAEQFLIPHRCRGSRAVRLDLLSGRRRRGRASPPSGPARSTWSLERGRRCGWPSRPAPRALPRQRTTSDRDSAASCTEGPSGRSCSPSAGASDAPQTPRRRPTRSPAIRGCCNPTASAR